MKSTICAAAVCVLATMGWAGCPSADLTGDCTVDLADLEIFGPAWLSGCGNPDWCQSRDFDRNGRVELWDLSILAGQWMFGGYSLPANMIPIPGGSFQVGNPFEEEFPEFGPHPVTVDSFAIGRYEITNGQFCAFLNSAYPSMVGMEGGYIISTNTTSERYYYLPLRSFSRFSQIDYVDGKFVVMTKNGRDMSNDPMMMVSWYGAVVYCNWRSGQAGREPCYDLTTWACDFSRNGFRLPTEAEWEYAARGGVSGRRFGWGDTITHSQANYNSHPYYVFDISPTRGDHPIWNDGIFPFTSPVGTFLPNGFGLYDMAGNVTEWCNDWHRRDYYLFSPIVNPTGPATGDDGHRVIRGGSWGYQAHLCQAGARYKSHPSVLDYTVGFRIVVRLE